MNLAEKIDMNRYRIGLVKNSNMTGGNYTVFVPPAVNDVRGLDKVSTCSPFMRFRDAKAFADSLIECLKNNGIKTGWIHRS